MDGQTKEVSELEEILVRNSRGFISSDDWRRAAKLIETEPLGEESCCLCRYNKAIQNTPYCREHAFYLLESQK